MTGFLHVLITFDHYHRLPSLLNAKDKFSVDNRLLANDLSHSELVSRPGCNFFGHNVENRFAKHGHNLKQANTVIFHVAPVYLRNWRYVGNLTCIKAPAPRPGNVPP